MTEGPRWTEGESGTYRDIARYAVPERERQIAIVTALVAAVTAEGAVLDLCCGEGLLTEDIARAMPGVPLLAYDGSDSMLVEVRRRIEDPDRLATRKIDLSAHDWRRFEAPLRAVVSSLAIHHLDGSAKRKLFADLHAALAPGGVLVIADIMQPVTVAGRQIAAQLWDEEVKRRAVALDGTLAGFVAFEAADWNMFRETGINEIDKPSSLAEHLDWLREAGFADIDIHWMMAGHAIVSGWRI